jgi:hypothetical protein
MAWIGETNPTHPQKEIALAHFNRPDRKILTINHKPIKLAAANRALLIKDN